MHRSSLGQGRGKELPAKGRANPKVMEGRSAEHAEAQMCVKIMRAAPEGGEVGMRVQVMKGVGLGDVERVGLSLNSNKEIIQVF